MYSGAIVGEEFEGEVPQVSLLDRLGSMTKNILETGAKVYTLEQQRKIAGLQLSRETLAATATERAKRAQLQSAGMLGTGGGVPMTTGGVKLPIVPILIGATVLGAIAFIATRKK